ncbi:MAG: LLM class flavin-dependent oxidoreductase, partial [Chloroflexota bacterium]
MPEFSLSLDNRSAALDPRYGFAGLIRLAERADDSPLSTVWVGDSLLDAPGFEPIATLGAVATRTSRIRIGTSILQPHFRNGILLASSWATLDHMSGGRTSLGLGIGGGAPAVLAQECQEVGISPESRGKVLEETVLLLRQLWTGTHPDFQLPVRPLQASVPIWIASGIYVPLESNTSAQAGLGGASRGRFSFGNLGRVARLADGWFTIMATPDDMSAGIQRLKQLAMSEGRDPGSITPCLEVYINVGDSAQRCFQELRDNIRRYFGGASVPDEIIKRWSIYGPPEECRRQLMEFEAAGVDHFKFVIGAD